jgi:hypothetical protein
MTCGTLCIVVCYAVHDLRYGTVTAPYEWSTRSTLYCTHMSAHLTDIKYTAYPYVLQAYDDPVVNRLKNKHVCVKNMHA